MNPDAAAHRVRGFVAYKRQFDPAILNGRVLMKTPAYGDSLYRLQADYSVPIHKLNLKRLAVVHAPVNDLKA